MNQDKDRASAQQPRPALRGPRGMTYMGKPQDFKGTMKKLLKYLRPYRFQVMGAGLMAITAALLTVLGPWFLGLITSEVARAYEAANGVFSNIEFGLIHIIWNVNVSLGELALLIVTVHVLSAGFNYLQAFLLIGMTQNLTYGMRTELSAKINRLPLKYFDNQQFGDLLGRVTNDVETINVTLTQSIAEIFRSI
ncbi:MAG: ABC transporter transmembrane domain-containing protein, partial [Acholeplasmataceae bacterium]|nr:ABC transporter transmembrane domain-containing protein [Acholeplasmataceae bacterium]